MKSRWFSCAMVLFLFLALGVSSVRANSSTNAEPLLPMGSSFTYQGQLKNSSGNPITDSCDFRFILYDAGVGGAQVGPTQEKIGISVQGGYFTVGLDFGSSVFLGDARWLEVAVKCSGDTGYITLTPRQPLTPTPYALNSDLLDGQQASTFASAVHYHWGQTWTGAGTGLTLSGGTIGLSGSGSTFGVYGTSDSTSGVGVDGIANATSGFAYGVVGNSASTSGVGVYGDATATSGYTFGVYAVSSSVSGTGVFGVAYATTGTTYGVFGSSVSDSGTGVYGKDISNTGVTYGVSGYSVSDSGTGVYGEAGATSGLTYGVYGLSSSESGIGVYGRTEAITATTYGVYGYIDSTNGSGVYGWADYNNATTTTGVYGRTDSIDGFGVAGHAYWTGVGVGAWSYNGNLIEAYAGDYPYGTLEFYINPVGNVYANGTYNTFRTSSLDGETHTTSSIESTEVWLEDFGRGELVNGIAVVTIAPDFAGTANLSVDYMVFVTLEGDCQGVYITNKTPTTFEVHELNSGKSNVPFGYRIVAKPTGSESTRLPTVTIPATVDVQRPPDEATQPQTAPQDPQVPAPVEQEQLPN